VLGAFQKALGASGLSVKKIQEHSDAMVDFTTAYLHK
jgi:hypothetical protein